MRKQRGWPEAPRPQGINGASRPLRRYDDSAIALIEGAALATRSVKDFTEMGVELINPWDGMN